ncbi:hypothetical protein E2C01_072163 [Portunus trituberculatus]|uniref:Uncharacterized protein n=1 Tax=Portunus trituberculatus TaxID=210409 RepID=A0A5B7HX99_PORTR|nr:hypothetical protein [Portunus trituberculatus]
MKGGSSPSLV